MKDLRAETMGPMTYMSFICYTLSLAPLSISPQRARLHEDLLAFAATRRARAPLTMFTCASKDTGGSRDTHKTVLIHGSRGANNER